VTTGDGKGVIMRRTLAEELRADRESVPCGGPGPLPSRLGSGSGAPLAPPTVQVRLDNNEPRRPCKNVLRVFRPRRWMKMRGRRRMARKQMAYVGAVYTIDRFRRTTDEILDEMASPRADQETPTAPTQAGLGRDDAYLEGEPVSGVNGCSAVWRWSVSNEIRIGRRILICLLDGNARCGTCSGTGLAERSGFSTSFT